MLFLYFFRDVKLPISGVKQIANYDIVKHLSGKLSDHFAITINADGKVEAVDKIICLHCNK